MSTTGPQFDWVKFDNFTVSTITTINTSVHTIKPGESNWIVYDELVGYGPHYKGGTKLLRDYAELSNDYIEKKSVSRFGWKTRREIRNV